MCGERGRLTSTGPSSSVQVGFHFLTVDPPLGQAGMRLDVLRPKSLVPVPDEFGGYVGGVRVFTHQAERALRGPVIVPQVRLQGAFEVGGGWGAIHAGRALITLESRSLFFPLFPFLSPGSLFSERLLIDHPVDRTMVLIRNIVAGKAGVEDAFEPLIDVLREDAVTSLNVGSVAVHAS